MCNRRSDNVIAQYKRKHSNYLIDSESDDEPDMRDKNPEKEKYVLRQNNNNAAKLMSQEQTNNKGKSTSLNKIPRFSHATSTSSTQSSVTLTQKKTRLNTILDSLVRNQDTGFTPPHNNTVLATNQENRDIPQEDRYRNNSAAILDLSQPAENDIVDEILDQGLVNGDGNNGNVHMENDDPNNSDNGNDYNNFNVNMENDHPNNGENGNDNNFNENIENYNPNNGENDNDDNRNFNENLVNDDPNNGEEYHEERVNNDNVDNNFNEDVGNELNNANDDAGDNRNLIRRNNVGHSKFFFVLQ